jgi:hypothetical protein
MATLPNPTNTQRLGIRLKRDAILENSPLPIGHVLAEIELADGTTLEDLQRALADGDAKEEMDLGLRT